MMSNSCCHGNTTNTDVTMATAHLNRDLINLIQYVQAWNITPRNIVLQLTT